MADQCIVCLDVLDVDDALPPKGDIVESEVIVKSELEDLAPATAHNHHADTQQQLAVIQTCGHILHDSCLKEWIQKANSCPICRQQFNLVEIHDKTYGESTTLAPTPTKSPQNNLLTLFSQAQYFLHTQSKTKSRWPTSTHLLGLRTKPKRRSCQGHAPYVPAPTMKMFFYYVTHAMRHTTLIVLVLTVYLTGTGFVWSVSTRAPMLAVQNHPWLLAELAAGTTNAPKPR